MSCTSEIIVQEPVEVPALFAAARDAVGLPDARWYRSDQGEVHLLQTEGGQGAAAHVSILFAADGGPYPGDSEDGSPDGYAWVLFKTSGTDREEGRAAHERLVAALGAWLCRGGLLWSWRYEDGIWVAGNLRRGDHA